ncbi:MAG: AAA family ATPase, partial [Eggerthellaceae bacterium]|nr:AAA family ATPase [Eggerthellaceae bacterium]
MDENQNTEEEPLAALPEALYLQYCMINSFGLISDAKVGPFGPGLTIVYGKNEAGKSTLAAFIKGVLFGWERARAHRNPYTPVGSERSGSLYFASPEAKHLEKVELFRGGPRTLKGDISIIDDIDEETFRTLFFLSSDELRSLNNSSEVISRLLTAGSGTVASPARALAEIQDRINTFTSKAAANTHSFVHLKAEGKQVKEQLQKAKDEAQKYRDEDLELKRIENDRVTASDAISQKNIEAERLSSAQAELESIASRKDSLNADSRKAEHDMEMADGHCREEKERIGDVLATMSEEEDASIREELDELDERMNALERNVDVAQEAYRNAKADFDATDEVVQISYSGKKKKGGSSKRSSLMISLDLPIVVVLCGLCLTMIGTFLENLPVI